MKDLRDRSGAPMLECKKALAAEKGDVSKAMDWLRAKGIAKAAANVKYQRFSDSFSPPVVLACSCGGCYWRVCCRQSCLSHRS